MIEKASMSAQIFLLIIYLNRSFEEFYLFFDRISTKSSIAFLILSAKLCVSRDLSFFDAEMLNLIVFFMGT